MHLTFLIAAVCCLAAATPEGARDPMPVVQQPSMPDTEKEILLLENERVQALLKRDFATLERLMASECFLIESNGVLRIGAEFIANLKTSDATFDIFVIDENKVRIYGNTALVTGRYHNAIRKGGHVQPVKHARHTRVWVRQADGKWRLVSHQATEIPSA